MSNATWAIILVSALIVLTLIVRLVDRSVMVIVICHNAIWAGAIALIGTNLIRYAEASVEAWLVLASGIVAFNGGVLIAAIRRNRSRSVDIEHAAYAPTPAPLLSKRIFFVLLGLYGIGFAVYLSSTISRYGFERFLTDPESIRALSGESYLASVPLFARLLLYLGPLLFVSLAYKSAVAFTVPIVIRVLAVALMALSMLALLQRTNLFVAVLWLVAIFITRRATSAGMGIGSSSVRRQTLRERIIRGPYVPLVVGGLVMLAAFQIVGGVMNKNAQQALSTGVVSPTLAETGLTSPFGYYTGGTVAFLQLVDSRNASWPGKAPAGEMLIGDNNPLTLGAVTFAPILKVVPWDREWNEIAPFIDIGGGMLTNVFTWFEPLYRDFRAPGVVVGMLIMGWVMARTYLRRFETTRMFWVQSALVSTIFLATFVPKFNSNLLLAGLLLVLLLTVRKDRLEKFAESVRRLLSAQRTTGTSL